MQKYVLLSFVAFLLWGCNTGSSSSGSSISTSTGQAGSMARFAISGDYLYTLNAREMNVLDISDVTKPKYVSKVQVPFDVETLFSYKENLYIGASSGMYVYDNATPTLPTRIAEFTHAQSCDPVVISEDVAFVTLNTGSSCWNNRTGINRLEIIDVQVPESPKLIKAVDMWEPSGLGIDGNHLFICDGSSGLKVFDVNKTDTNGTVAVTIDLLENQDEIDCYDVIAHEKHLIVSNRNDIRQFDYTVFPMAELGRVK